jgi:hypothetical protein
VCLYTLNLEVGGDTGAVEWAEELAKKGEEIRVGMPAGHQSPRERQNEDVVAVSLDEGGTGQIFRFPLYACIRSHWDDEYDDLMATQNEDPKAIDGFRVVVAFGKVRLGDWKI